MNSVTPLLDKLQTMLCERTWRTVPTPGPGASKKTALFGIGGRAKNPGNAPKKTAGGETLLPQERALAGNVLHRE